MDDLGAMLSQFLNSSEGQAQLGALASALGVQGSHAAPQPQASPAGGQIDIASLLSGLQAQSAPPPAPRPQPAASAGGQPDIASLLSGLQAQLVPPPAPQPQPAASAGGQLDIASLLSGLQAQSAPPPPAAPAGGGLDMAGLGQLLSALNTSAPPPAQPGQGNGLNLGALAGLLGGNSGGQSPPAQPSPTPGIDIGALMGLQRAFSAFGGDRNTALLQSLKPSLSPERQKKVDDAVRLLQLMKLLPLIKDTGLFGDMNWLSGGDRP